MPYCPHCGSSRETHHTFCPDCGSRYGEVGPVGTYQQPDLRHAPSQNVTTHNNPMGVFT